MFWLYVISPACLLIYLIFGSSCDFMQIQFKHNFCYSHMIEDKNPDAEANAQPTISLTLTDT